MQRMIVMPPGTPQAAVDAMRRAVRALNDDPVYAAEARKALQFVPHYEAGADINDKVLEALTIPPGMREFIMAYIKKVAP
jgi:tripartite-type tricarboxylate transporter receptor subunit TctC